MKRTSLAALAALLGAIACSGGGATDEGGGGGAGGTAPAEAGGAAAQSPTGDGAGGTPAAEPSVGASQAAGSPAPAAPAPAWQDEGWEDAFSFVDNRHLLHTYDTGLFMDVGSPSGLKYVHGRWHGAHWNAGTREGDDTLAWTDGVRAVLRFPVLDASVEYELVARMRGSSGSQRMDTYLNEEQVGPTLTTIPASLDLIQVRLPVADMVTGENRVRFHFARSEEVAGQGRTAGGFDWVRIQPREQSPPAEHVDGAFSRAEVGGEPALVAPAYGGYDAYVMVPEGGRLRFRVQGSRAGLPAVVTVQADGAPAVDAWSGEAAGPEASEATSAEVDLSEHAGQVVRVGLRGTAEVAADTLSWVNPRVVVPAGEDRTYDVAQRPQHVFVWLVDTLRPDHFPVYNPETRVQAPNFVAFAEQCVTFLNATVQGNSSLPSSASIHTGTYPPVHGLTRADRRISRDLVTIAMPYDEAGWNTALMSSNGYVSESKGFGRGYDAYRNLIHEPGRPDSEYLWPVVRSWLEANPEGQSFVFINTIDPHVPYDPPAEILAQYYPGTYTGRIQPRGTGELLDRLGDDALEGDDLRYLIALYDGEITYNDIYFGQAIDYLRESGRLDDTVVVITSDHGEAFFEHDRGGHGSGVWETVVNVPLMICHPRSLGGGRVIDTEVELVDIMPTLDEMMGLEVAQTVQGGSLVPLIMNDGPAYNRPGFSYHGDDIRGMRMGRWKYILRGGDLDALYDIDATGGIERDNVREANPIAYRYARDVMSFHLAFETTWRKQDNGLANNHTPALAERLDGETW